MNSSVEVAFVSIIDSLTNFSAASLTTVAEMVDVRLVSTDSAAMSGGSRPLSQVTNGVLIPLVLSFKIASISVLGPPIMAGTLARPPGKITAQQGNPPAHWKRTPEWRTAFTSPS